MNSAERKFALTIVFPDSEARRTPVATLALDCDSVEDAVTAISYSDTLVCRHLVIRGLGVVIVDADRSDTSRAFVEQVAASPGLPAISRRRRLRACPPTSASSSAKKQRSGAR